MTFSTWLIQLLTFWVAYSHLIPISLYVIIEMLKLTQAYLIGKDVQMYDEETEKFGLCRNSDLIEELGQVDFVFSDKTGTLTQNKMVFKKCTVNNQIYGDPRPGEDKVDGIPPSTKELIKNLMENPKENSQGAALREFFTFLAVCHTSMVEKGKDGTYKYSASSPDELALVLGAKEVGIQYIERTSTSIVI